MVDTGIFATTQEVQDHVGQYANSTYNVEAYINRFIAEAESLINAECRYNFSDNYSTLNTDTKKLLTLAAATKTAMMVIKADMSAYPTTGMAMNHINILDTTYQEAIKLLRDDNVRIFINES